MKSEQFARAVAHSIARRQSRGLVDDAAGLDDVVIHGRVDLVAVADDLLATAAAYLAPRGKSWACWFARNARDRREALGREHWRAQLERQLEDGPTEADAALVRLRLRELD